MLSTDLIHIYYMDLELWIATHFFVLGIKLSLRRHKKQMFVGSLWSVAVLLNIRSIKLKTGSVWHVPVILSFGSSFEGTEEVVERGFCGFTLFPEKTEVLSISIFVLLICCLEGM